MDPRHARQAPARTPVVRSRLARLVPACVLLAALAALAAPLAAPAQTVTVRQAGKDLRITVGDAAALPADFPPDVSLPVTYTVVRVQRSDDSTTVVVATPGTVDAEAARFRAGMLAAGWSAARSLRSGSGR